MCLTFLIYLYIYSDPPVVTGWETVNKYDIMNSVGQNIYYAEEG